MKPRYNKILMCRYGHRIMPGNLILMGDQQKCARCHSPAFRRWYAQRRADLTRMADEAALRRIVDNQTQGVIHVAG